MRTKVYILSICMLLTGTINTIATKYQDLTVTGVRPDGSSVTFKHPAVQSAMMFFGEMLCLIPYFILRWRKLRARKARGEESSTLLTPEQKSARKLQRMFAFLTPALSDACGTTLINIGLYYTYASVYQMLRGTVVLFAGLFTILILKRRLFLHHWLGMALIFAGAALVGASSIIYSRSSSPHGGPDEPFTPHPREPLPGLTGGAGVGDSSSSSYSYLDGVVFFGKSGGGGSSDPGAQAPLFGDVLVVCAQMFTALQFILEEKFLVKYKVPALLAVGTEGCWGLILCAIVVPILSTIKGADGLPLDDALGAFREIAASRRLLFSTGLSVLSIAFFNFFGVSVTKSLSGAARATIDACRTLFIWLFSIMIGWEQFHQLQVLGFVVLISGTSLYNEIIKNCLPGGEEELSAGRSRGHSRRTTLDVEVDEALDPEMQQPLLSNPLTPKSGNSVTASMPVVRANASTRYDDPSPSAGDYTMARSMRIGHSAISPHSLDSALLSESGSYLDCAALDATPSPQVTLLGAGRPPTGLSGSRSNRVSGDGQGVLRPPQ